MAANQITPSSEVTFGHRLAARLIDYSIFNLAWYAAWYFFYFLVASIVGFSGNGSPAPVRSGLANLTGFLGSAVVWVGLSALFETAYGSTPGKWITGLVTLSESGTRINPVQAVVRTLALYLDGMWLGLVAMDYMKTSARHQRYGDWLVKTVVVKHQDMPDDVRGSSEQFVICLVISVATILSLTLIDVALLFF